MSVNLSPSQLSLRVPEAGTSVSALVLKPPSPKACFAFAHGAGAGMRHAFMEALSERLAAHDVATLRYQFPYFERGERRPDRQPVLFATIRAAVEAARDVAEGAPLVAGGKSMGGRMTTLAASDLPLPDVRGIVLVGFPLHGMGKPPGAERAEHLAHVTVPMLFLQGTRDTLADLGLMRGVCDGLGRRATLHVVDGADHGFHVLKRSGRTDEEVLEDLALTIASWIPTIPG